MPIQADFIRRVISMVFLFLQNCFKRCLASVKRHSLVFLARLELRVSTSKSSHFSKGLCQPLKHVLQSPRVGDIPMLVFLKTLEMRQMLRHFRIRKSLPIAAVISHRKRNKVVAHNAYDIQVSVEMFQGLIVKKFMCCISHGLSSIKSLTPAKWVGRHIVKRQCLACLPT